MNLQDYAAIAVAIVTVLGGVAALLRFVILHYLAELKPNSGSSMRDEVALINNRLVRVEAMLELLTKGK
jgi:hypothetical protein